MKPSYVIAIVLSIFLVGCGGANKDATPFEQQAQPSQAQNFPAHSARNSLDWNGVYTGQLPCADCTGIDTSLTLHSDQTYTLEESYLGQDEAVFSSSGRFEWNRDGNVIILDNSVGAINHYFVAENQLWKLDIHGQKVQGPLADKYRLIKQ
ncbi:copper resistance protein NlpE [Vibrio sonorensis]|uniref:copper resistance protein NlpE n=1 Tax=Vibrio sonorensis TaxID=1004316 RepID=UPI0008DB08A4|nr:copper resistance protein NlpE [Vibrio sonorensis]